MFNEYYIAVAIWASVEDVPSGYLWAYIGVAHGIDNMKAVQK